MTQTVAVIDYGMGNLFSVSRAFESRGCEVRLVDTPEQVEGAELLVLPGVGAFRDGMAGLRERGLVTAIRRYAATGRPLLGICLGMQMLLEASEEFGEHEGLGLIPGRVVALPPTNTDGEPHKIPHIGWNELVPPGGDASRWERTVLDGIARGEAAYFVHSFNAQPTSEENRLADCYYGGVRIAAAVRAGNVCGCQFHPEKSGPRGLRMIENFIAAGEAGESPRAAAN